ncbi:hypothetical protein [Lysobacter sp. F60174L2]|uniref:hypothetical protein n=1 Tax=Lysobacter sp. F60174L2 TaxID=3459295 RepID=UPI00403DF933
MTTRPGQHARPPNPAPPRRSVEDTVLPESRASLWLLTAGPATWAVHFLLSYVTAAIWCARAATVAAPLGTARVALVVYTVAALAVIVVVGWRSWRQHQWGDAELPHDAASAGDRHRFLGFATLLLCGLGFVAVVYSALAIGLIGTCR